MKMPLMRQHGHYPDFSFLKYRKGVEKDFKRIKSPKWLHSYEERLGKVSSQPQETVMDRQWFHISHKEETMMFMWMNKE